MAVVGGHKEWTTLLTKNFFLEKSIRQKSTSLIIVIVVVNIVYH